MWSADRPRWSLDSGAPAITDRGSRPLDLTYTREDRWHSAAGRRLVPEFDTRVCRGWRCCCWGSISKDRAPRLLIAGYCWWRVLCQFDSL
jgi:hypothetical protein